MGFPNFPIGGDKNSVGSAGPGSEPYI